MTEAPAALRVVDLHVSYGQRNVLRGLNLSIANGEIFGLLGPNGAGKTTLIRAICGRIRPASGMIAIMGQPVSRRVLRRVGLSPQEIALYPHLTARENLEVFGRLSGLARPQTAQAIAWASAAVDIQSRLGDRIDILSGGWKQRVNIAAAILHRPNLLILDEPTVGVDVDARNGLHEVVQQLSRAGLGVLLTTHDMDQAEVLCSRVGFLRDGQIAPQGSPRELIEASFDGERELIIELRHPPAPPHLQLLRGLGFTASSNDMTWSTMDKGSGRSTAELSDALERAGLGVRQIRLREPALDSLFMRLSREAGSAKDRAA